MPRLGELLVAAGLLTIEQVEHALRAQVLWGGRLGTNIVELHYLELDPLSRMLARQHHMPAALARHFEKADPALQRMLSPDFAERFSCVPLMQMGPERHVAIASLAPLLPRQMAIIADELGVEVDRLVPAIAAELRIRYQLERVYNIRRAARFLRARGKTVPPFPAFQGLVVAPEPRALPTSTREIEAFRPGRPDDDEPDDITAPIERVPDVHDEPTPPPAAAPRAPRAHELDDGWTDDAAAVPTALDHDDSIRVEVVPPTTATGELDDLTLQATLDDEPAPPDAEPRGRERRSYISTIADAPSSESERQALLGRIAIRKVAVGSAPRVMAGATLGEATRAIRRSTSRDRVADLVIDTLERFVPACEAAILLVIRGATAIGWKGFQRGGALGEIALPMEQGGLVPGAVDHNVTQRRPCGQLDAIDRLLLGSLGRASGDLAVVPIAIAEQVMCVIALAGAEDAPLATAEVIATAAGAAFTRLMRDASR